MKNRQFILIFIVLLVICGELFLTLNYSKKVYNQLDGTNYILVEVNQTLNNSDNRMKSNFENFDMYLENISSKVFNLEQAYLKNNLQ